MDSSRDTPMSVKVKDGYADVSFETGKYGHGVESRVRGAKG
jgi:hypothetical protein